jgi:hypothetical protein
LVWLSLVRLDLESALQGKVRLRYVTLGLESASQGKISLPQLINFIFSQRAFRCSITEVRRNKKCQKCMSMNPVSTVHLTSCYQFIHNTHHIKSSVGIATDYGLDDRIIGVRIPAGAGNLSLHYGVHTGSWGPSSLLSSAYWGLFPWG